LSSNSGHWVQGPKSKSGVDNSLQEKEKKKRGGQNWPKTGVFIKVSVGWVLEIAPNPLPPGIGAFCSITMVLKSHTHTQFWPTTTLLKTGGRKNKRGPNNRPPQNYHICPHKSLVSQLPIWLHHKIGIKRKKERHGFRLAYSFFYWSHSAKEWN
jgi:hypothetical protein